MNYRFWFLSSLTLLLTLFVLVNYASKTMNVCILKNQGSSWIVNQNKVEAYGLRVDNRGNFFIPVKINEVSQNVIYSTLAVEDARFFNHFGLDIMSLARAIFQNVTHMKIISGASTITMQTARMLHPKNRSFGNKIIEMFEAFYLEFKYTKYEILEMYLNLAPYGGNRVGIESAGRKYFNKKSKDLTLSEASFLAGIPQKPTTLNPLKNFDKALKRREYVLKRLVNIGFYNASEINRVSSEKLFLANSIKTKRNISDFIVNRFGNNSGTILTTIDADIQKIIENKMNEVGESLRDKGIDACGVVVIDVENSSLSGIYSNMDDSNPLNGFVNSATVKRQPGSLMKPFLYALAFEKGLIIPESIVSDSPVSWKNYSPLNADKKYLGDIPVKQALSLSRNVPAVRILEKVGVKYFVNLLHELEVFDSDNNADMGLSLILGTTEVSLLDITNAYACIARLGTYKNLKVCDNEEIFSKDVFLKGACYLTLRCLGASKEDEVFSVAYKTGTSWHNRDAWAIALSPHYVVGVFSGNMSGSSNSYLKGSEVSLPIAKNLLEQILSFKKIASNWKKPSSIIENKVCVSEGVKAGLFCPKTIAAECISGMYSDAICVNHGVNADNKNKIDESQILIKHNSDYKHISQESPFRIIFPVKSASYIGTKENNIHMQFMVNTENNFKESLYWFLDGVFITSTLDKINIEHNVGSGVHILTVSDKNGFIDEVDFSVLEKVI